MNIKTDYALAVSLVLLAGAIFFFGIQIKNSIYDIEAKLNQMDTRSRAVSVIEAFHRSTVFPMRNRICKPGDENDDVEALCRLTSPKTYRNVGSHDDLWVFFDAAIITSRSALTQPDRGEFDARLALVVAALAQTGVWQLATSDNAPPVIAASDFYQSVVAQAALCLELKDAVACHGALPADLKNALGNLATFIVEKGPQISPYEISFRLEAVKAVSNELLGPEKTSSRQTF